MVLHRIFMRNEKEGIQMQTRREFLKKSAALLGSAAVVGSVPGLLKAQAEDGQEVPAYPYPYVELDPAYVEKLAYEGYFENGCCFGVAKAILVALREKVGYPYTVIPEEMFANGKEGYTCGTLCGALGGAVAMIGLVCASADSRQLTKDLFAWYCSTNLPIYQPEAAAPVQTVAPSVNCIDSITKFMTAANVERGDISVSLTLRCSEAATVGGRRRTLKLLNAHFGSAELPGCFFYPRGGGRDPLAQRVHRRSAVLRRTLRVKVTMDGDKRLPRLTSCPHATPPSCFATRRYDTESGPRLSSAAPRLLTAATARPSPARPSYCGCGRPLSKVGKLITNSQQTHWEDFAWALHRTPSLSFISS